MPIFVSTTFAGDGTSVLEVVNFLETKKIERVELGSVHRYETSVIDQLANKANMKYLVHNYFPAPPLEFVINLASTDPEIRRRSVNFVKQNRQNLARLGAPFYTVHPGFVGDPTPPKTGKSYDFNWADKSLNYERALEAMWVSIDECIEAYRNEDAFLLLETEGSFREPHRVLLKNCREFDWFCKRYSPDEIGLNLNLAHLFLSSQVFNFDVEQLIQRIWPWVRAIELSHSNKIDDLHQPLRRDGWYWPILKKLDLTKKALILEFRNTDFRDVRTSLSICKELIGEI